MMTRESKSSRYMDAEITVPEAAVLLGISRQTFHGLLDKGLITYRVPSKQRRVRRGDVLAYKESTAQGGVAEPAFAGGEDALRD